MTDTTKPREAAMGTARRIADRLETNCSKLGFNLSLSSEDVVEIATLIDADKTELVEASKVFRGLVVDEYQLIGDLDMGYWGGIIIALKNLDAALARHRSGGGA